jgi:hypothetical protein
MPANRYQLHYRVHTGLNHVQALLYGKLESDAPVKFLKIALREGSVSLGSVARCLTEMRLAAFCPYVNEMPSEDRYEKIVSTLTMYVTKLRSACRAAMPELPDTLLVIVVNYITGNIVSIARKATDLTR